MATYNSNPTAASVLSSSVASSVGAVAAAGQFEHNLAAAGTTFLVPTSTTSLTGVPTPLHFVDSFVTAAPQSHAHFVTTTPTAVAAAAVSAAEVASTTTTAHHHHQHSSQLQHIQPHSQHQRQQQMSNTTSSTSSYTFVQIKREPCQVSEVTTSNNCHQKQHQQRSSGRSGSSTASTTHHHNQQQQHHQLHSVGSSSIAGAACTSKAMSSSTLHTLVKIEAASPKVPEMDKYSSASVGGSSQGASTNNAVPVGIAVARKRPQESSNCVASMGNPTTSIPMQQTLSKDMSCFGIRVADLGGVGTSCGNFYFTGSTGDLMTGPAATAEELALQNLNRAPSTFWQYPSALPIESVISMSPATVGLAQYSREASRGQVVLLPTATALDPFQQAAAAAFVWPSLLAPQGSASAAAAAAAAALQPPPANFIFPSVSPHSTLQTQPYAATSLQLFGTNYLTAAAAAAAAAAATSTFCQHNQQTNSTNSINLSLAGTAPTSSCSSSSSSSSRYLSVAQTSGGTLDMQKHHQKHMSSSMTTTSFSPSAVGGPLLLPPAAMKIEEWNATEFMATAAASKATTLASSTTTHHQHTQQQVQHQTAMLGVMPQTMPLTMPLPVPVSVPMTMIDGRVRGNPVTTTSVTTTATPTTTAATTTTTNLFEFPCANNQALNLIRIPTPPSSATIEGAATASSLQPQILFHAGDPAATTGLLNLSTTAVQRSATTTMSPANFHLSNSSTTTTTLSATIGPPTPVGDDATTAAATTTATSMATMHFKTGQFDVKQHQQSQIAMGVGIRTTTALPTDGDGVSLPQMQDVNIQTDTPICSEDENESSLCLPQAPNSIAGTAVEAPMPAATNGAMMTPPPQTNDYMQQPGNIREIERQAPEEPLELTKPHIVTNEAENSGTETEATAMAEGVTVTGNAAECHSSTSEGGANEKMQIISGGGGGGGVGSETVETEGSRVLHASSTDHRPEDLTGLELLSNISAGKLVKDTSTSKIRVKQEPLDHSDETAISLYGASPEKRAKMDPGIEMTGSPPMPPMILNSSLGQSQSQNQHEVNSDFGALSKIVKGADMPAAAAMAEPLGGLSLLCALAEQRIQEEVQNSGGGVGGGSLFGGDYNHNNNNNNNNDISATSISSFSYPSQQQPAQKLVPTSQLMALEPPSTSPSTTFPSMVGIELPIACNGNGNSGGDNAGGDLGVVVKRKKHKHSKSSKSSSGSGKKSQRCSKKNKKKYSKEKDKEKRKHKLRQQAALHASLASSASPMAAMYAGASIDDLDFEDEELREEFKSAINNSATSDPSHGCFGQWPDPQKIFSIMETNMRQRLADITRQYRKKKRKLDEISKNKKNKKRSKQLQQQLQQQQQQQQPAASSPFSLSCGLSSVTPPLTLGGDYKFSTKFSSKNVAPVVGSSYLNTSSFMRFGEKSLSGRIQFPPPDVDLNGGDNTTMATVSSSATGTSTPAITCKPVRLEPSTLASCVENRGAPATTNVNNSVLRLTQKHCTNGGSSLSVTSIGTATVVDKKERKLTTAVPSSRRCSDADDCRTVSPLHLQKQKQQQQQGQSSQQQSPVQSPPLPHPRDRELLINNEHLYRKETRVLTDMGGLFYAGVMKPLQPPDIYAITLDGERGNKSHIMSREEIFKDTIVELSPKSADCVPPGTRLCAYWSQQYRCLYPGRAIEFSDDGNAANNEFVSVEFDDGDSGRIPLQNIRFLLSDYPIAEYNDNPLYSLGKHKKSGATKSGQQHNQQQQQQQEQQNNNTKSHNDAQQYQQARELYAQRNEKKRLKGLKKKSKAAAAAAAAAVAGGSVSGLAPTVAVSSRANIGATNGLLLAGEVNGGGGGGDGGVDCAVERKHHKHKKHKKHKKHHHRKSNVAEDDGNKSYVLNTAAAVAAAAAVTTVIKSSAGGGAYMNGSSKRPDNLEHQEDTLTRDTIKMETLSTTPSMSNAGAGAVVSISTNGSIIKVKSEQLYIEEETASTNFMSEISDETKGDDEIEPNNSKGSKIAAFLPDRQLWGWLGKAYRKAGVKGRARKQFYKTIKRGKETITVGDCAVFLSTGRPDRPYIGRIESMWETTSSNKVVRVRWFYHPEETTGCPDLKYPGALFESPHEDENDVQTISHRCAVLPFQRYFDKFGSDTKQYQSIYDNNDTYYLAGYYNPRLQTLKLQVDIPTLEEHNNTTTTTTHV